MPDNKGCVEHTYCKYYMELINLLCIINHMLGTMFVDSGSKKRGGIILETHGLSFGPKSDKVTYYMGGKV